jgi:hypothetical protein
MESLLSDWWIVGLALAAGAYVLGTPLVILATFRHEANPAVEAVAADELPSAVRAHVDRARQALAPAGFVDVQSCFLPQAMANVRSVLTVFVNRRTRDAAAAVTIFALVDEQWHVQLQYVEFSTRFRSGRVINTGNPQYFSAFPPRENYLKTHIPWIDDPVELYRVHAAIVAAQGDGERELRLDHPYRGDVLAFVSGGMRDELEAARDAGYLRLAAGGAHYRATLKGAYLMTWKQLPPFKGFVIRNRHRQVRRLLAELGIEA